MKSCSSVCFIVVRKNIFVKASEVSNGNFTSSNGQLTTDICAPKLLVCRRKPANCCWWLPVKQLETPSSRFSILVFEASIVFTENNFYPLFIQIPVITKNASLRRVVKQQLRSVLSFLLLLVTGMNLMNKFQFTDE